MNKSLLNVKSMPMQNTQVDMYKSEPVQKFRSHETLSGDSTKILAAYETRFKIFNSVW